MDGGGFRGAVVITGASSGVGRATAHRFAREGAALVLAAREPGPLEAVAGQARELGARTAIAVPTDTRDLEAVRELARIAAERCDGIAVWVNNAGVGAVGAFWRVPFEVHRAVIETNLMGYLHGAHAALPYMTARGRGVIVNNVSVGGFVPAPYAAAYAASKFGVRAFSDALRQELAGWPAIAVCALYPYFLDTPGVQHGANWSGVRLKPAPLVDRPERVAEAILGLARHPRRELVLGPLAKAAKLQHALLPGLTQWLGGQALRAWFATAPERPPTDGRVLAPLPGPMATHGGWRRPGERAAVAAGAGLAGAAILLALARRRASRPQKRSGPPLGKGQGEWSEWRDLNTRPLRPERSALPG